MKSTLTRIALALAALLSLSAFAQTQTAANGPAPGGGATTTAAPTGPAPTKIGLIAMRDVVLSTNDGKRQFDALTKKYEPKDAELRKAAQEVEALQNQYKAQADKMNEDSRAQMA